MYASGVNVFWEASNELLTPQRVAPLSNPNTSAFKALFCWIAIPPSPAAFEPEAKRINLSATSRSVVLWKEAVPNTVKFLDTTKSRPIVTSLGKPIVIVVPAAEVSISFAVPPIVRS